MADSLKKDGKQEQTTMLQRLKAAFLEDYRAEEGWRQSRREFGRFYDGDQLSDEEKRELERRGQPAVVINRIKPKMDAIFGIFQELAVETKAFPLGDRENEAVEISERFRRIENDSHFNEEELLVFKDLVIDGAGYYKMVSLWDGLDKRTVVEHAPNHHVTLDKFCRRADLKDAKRIHEHVWMDLDDAKELFPGHDDELEAMVQGPEAWVKYFSDRLSQERPDQYQQQGGSRPVTDIGANDFNEYADQGRKRIRIVTTYYRTTKVRSFIRAGGETQDVTDMSEADRKKVMQAFEDAQEWTQEDKLLHCSTFCWGTVLDEKKNIRPFDREGKFPFVKAHAYVSREEEIKRPYGLVKQHLDPQREVNKRRSKMLHLLNTNQTWFEEGAFEEEAQARAEISRPDAWVKYRKEFKVERITHQEVAQAQFQLLQESKREIDQAGVNDELEGESKARSGREFQLRLKEGLKAIRELMTNIRAARRRVFEYCLDEELEDMKREAKKQGQEFTLRKFDVVIEEAAESVNLQSEVFDSLIQFASSGAPIPPRVLIKASTLPPKVKDEILQELQAAAEQQAAQGLPPQEHRPMKARHPR
jgi:hypothetical protein